MLVVEDLPRLDVAQIRALPEWPRIRAAGEVSIVIGQGPAQTVRLASDDTIWGTRWWWCCPACSRRKKHLFLVEGKLACRRCHRALYFQQALPGCRWRRDTAIPALQLTRVPA